MDFLGFFPQTIWNIANIGSKNNAGKNPSTGMTTIILLMTIVMVICGENKCSFAVLALLLFL
jgi:hypothetical protein